MTNSCLWGLKGWSFQNAATRLLPALAQRPKVLIMGTVEAVRKDGASETASLGCPLMNLMTTLPFDRLMALSKAEGPIHEMRQAFAVF
jgi:hypothetical protein